MPNLNYSQCKCGHTFYNGFCECPMCEIDKETKQSKIISIWDFEITPGNKLNKESLYLREALKRIKGKNQFKIEEFETVIDPWQLLLTLCEVANDVNKKRDNINARR